MLYNMPLLSLLIWFPMIGAVFVLMSGSNCNSFKAKTIALAVAVVELLLSIPLYTRFDLSTYQMQFQEIQPWINDYKIYYALGVDGISMPLVILTTLTTLVIVLSGWTSIKEKVAQYMAAFLVMEGMMIGMFAAMDSVLFYVFWEAILIPMYIAIGVWGSTNRTYASFKFFLYTFFGSALMLVVILYLRMQSNSFAIQAFYEVSLSIKQQVLIFIGLLLGFAIKVPMWPVHTWLPDAHTEAPAGGSVLLAALMLKMGAYGFLRFLMPIVPDACQGLAWVLIVLSLIAVIYIGLVALAQTDMKKLIAYSSIAHMGFVSLGCFMIYEIVRTTGNVQDAVLSLEGGIIQMISHAFGSGALFIGVGILYDRMHTRKMRDYGGVASAMPVFAALYMIFILSNVGLPGTSGFVGEFMVIMAAFQANFWVAFCATTTLILGASYSLLMYKRVFFGEITNKSVATLQDINTIETTMLVLLAACVLFFGIYPDPLINVMHSSVDHLLTLSLKTKLVF